MNLLILYLLLATLLPPVLSTIYIYDNSECESQPSKALHVRRVGCTRLTGGRRKSLEITRMRGCFFEIFSGAPCNDDQEVATYGPTDEGTCHELDEPWTHYRIFCPGDFGLTVLPTAVPTAAAMPGENALLEAMHGADGAWAKV